MNLSKFDSTKFYREFTTITSAWKGSSGIWDIEFMKDSRSVDLYGHAIPVIYIKAGDNDALFLVNSLGVALNHHNWIFKRNDQIKIYAIEKKREMANTGCYIDAFVFLNNAIGKASGEYRIPNLLQYLENNCQDLNDKRYSKVTKLPPRLLKTFQSSELIREYSNSQDEKIAVNKQNDSIAGHLSRYKKTSSNNCANHSYVAQKGMKMRAKVEIEFYLEQFPDITDRQKVEFRNGAKELLKDLRMVRPSSESVGYLHEYAINFAEKNKLLINAKQSSKFDITQYLSLYAIGGASVGAISYGIYSFTSSDIVYITYSEACKSIIKSAIVGAIISSVLCVGINYYNSIGASEDLGL